MMPPKQPSGIGTANCTGSLEDRLAWMRARQQYKRGCPRCAGTGRCGPMKREFCGCEIGRSVLPRLKRGRNVG